ncbi:hypothetical protein HQ545_01565 [Candidatus Woesearchaeota archaeon]|nr:hypothetical protein [Candidatus Woesearchaeota archaeon]
MKIEVDTKFDSKEELEHLAVMLRAIAGKSGAVRVPARVNARDAARQANIFDDPTPSGGLMGMFGNSSQSADAQPVATQSSVSPLLGSSASDGQGIFSLFSDDAVPENSDSSEVSSSDEGADEITESVRLEPY